MRGSQNEPDSDAVRFVERLTSEEQMLVVLKQELYDGCWNEMQADLQARLDGNPYIFKLAHRIEDDLERIKGLRAFEKKNNIDLSDFVTLETINFSGRAGDYS